MFWLKRKSVLQRMREIAGRAEGELEKVRNSHNAQTATINDTVKIFNEMWRKMGAACEEIRHENKVIEDRLKAIEDHVFPNDKNEEEDDD